MRNQRSVEIQCQCASLQTADHEPQPPTYSHSKGIIIAIDCEEGKDNSRTSTPPTESQNARVSPRVRVNLRHAPTKPGRTREHEGLKETTTKHCCERCCVRRLIISVQRTYEYDACFAPRGLMGDGGNSPLYDWFYELKPQSQFQNPDLLNCSLIIIITVHRIHQLILHTFHLPAVLIIDVVLFWNFPAHQYKTEPPIFCYGTYIYAPTTANLILWTICAHFEETNSDRKC